MLTPMRPVQGVVQPQLVLEGAGVLLKRSFPTSRLDYPDPFLLLDHFGSDNPEDYMAGFPTHPHRGIETVTYMLAGAVQHKDSIGNSGRIEAGDVQWMTAGGGILHEEMPQPVEGKMEGFQLWVNLPARLKMTRPQYQEIHAEEIQPVPLPGGGSLRVIAGEADGVSGPVVGIAADPTYLDIRLDAGEEFSRQVEPSYTLLAYLYRGGANFGEGSARESGALSAPRLVVFSEGEQARVHAGEKGASFLWISGAASGEPIFRYGPFVMNTRLEIERALQDLRDGTFIQA